MPGDGAGSFEPEKLTRLSLAEPLEPTTDETETAPTRVNWARWMEMDGSGGLELITSAGLGSAVVWTHDVDLESGLFEPRDPYELGTTDPDALGCVGDFDGDGVDDIAISNRVLFGKAVNQ